MSFKLNKQKKYLHSEFIIWVDKYYAEQIQKVFKKLETIKIWGCSKSYFWIELVQVSQFSWKAVWILFNKNISYLPQEFPYTNKIKDLNKWEWKTQRPFCTPVVSWSKSGIGHCILFPGFQKTKGLSSKWSCREPYGRFWKSHVLLNRVGLSCIDPLSTMWDRPNENAFTASPYWCSTAISG